MPDHSLTYSRAGVPPCPLNPPAFINLTAIGMAVVGRMVNQWWGPLMDATDPEGYLRQILTYNYDHLMNVADVLRDLRR